MAAADPLPVADVTQSAETDDGWHLSVALTRMTINSVPNMAATAFTREGFVTGKAAAAIDGNGAVAVISEPAPAASSRFVVRIRQHRKLAPDLGGLAAATELRLGQW